MSAPTREAPQVPANVLPFVEVLGPEKTIELLLKMGGANLYFSEHPRDDGRAVAIIGTEGMKALNKRMRLREMRVPLANRWIALYLRQVCDLSIQEIARRLRTSDVTVRSYLKEKRRSTALSKDQLQLL